MTAATLREVRTELATAIGPTLRCYDTLPASPIPPFAVVMWPDVIEFARTLSGRNEYTIPVTVYASLRDVTAGQEELDSYIQPIRNAIHEHDGSDVWLEAWVTDAASFRPESLGDVACLAVDLNTSIIA